MIDIKVGDVVYIKDNGKIRALKCTRIEARGSKPFSTSIPSINACRLSFRDPEGNFWVINHEGNSYDKPAFYKTIDSAINNCNIRTCKVDLEEIAKSQCPKNLHSTTLHDCCIRYYYWDGYGVKIYYRFLHYHDFYMDSEGWHLKYCSNNPDGNFPLFLTPEDAHRDKETIIIDF